MPPHELGRRADVDDASVVEDGHAVAQPLGLLHEMRRQKDGLAALADAAHQIPDRPPRLRVEPCRQLVEEDQLGVVDEREGDEQALLLAAGQRHEPGVPLVAQAELLDQTVAVDRLPVQGRPEFDRFPDLDPLLELRLLQLHADALLQRVHVSRRIQPQHGDGAPVGRAQTFDALHRRGLAGAVRPDQAEYLTRLNVERDLVDGHRPAVRLPDSSNVNDGLRRHRVRMGSNRFDWVRWGCSNLLEPPRTPSNPLEPYFGLRFRLVAAQRHRSASGSPLRGVAYSQESHSGFVHRN